MDYRNFLLITVLFLGFLTLALARPKICSHKGRLYRNGDQVTLDNCTYICTCDTHTQTTSVFLCEPLCARFIDHPCPSGHVETFVMVKSGPVGSGCYCALHKCIKLNNLRNQGVLQYSTQIHKKLKVRFKGFSIRNATRHDG